MQKARALLTKAIQKQGLDKVDQFENYEVVGVDDWKGLLGSMGKVWDWKDDKVVMRYAVGHFDGQIEVLEGKKKGFSPTTTFVDDCGKPALSPNQMANRRQNKF